MSDIERILGKEKVNGNSIYLYKIEDYWFACERSAFYLFSISCVDVVFKYSDPRDKSTILISVLKHETKAGNPLLKVIERTDNQMVLDCRITFKGFDQWKDGLMPMFNDLPVQKMVHNWFELLRKY